MSNIFNTPHEEIVTLATPATTALFATETPAKSAIILQHPDNVGNVACDYLSPPVTIGGLTLPATPDSQAGYFYNLAALKAKATNAGDKLIVIWYT